MVTSVAPFSTPFSPGLPGESQCYTTLLKATGASGRRKNVTIFLHMQQPLYDADQSAKDGGNSTINF